MSSQYEPLIQQALTEAKRGNKRGAKKILAQIIKQESQNARVWYLLSQVVENEEQAIYCLQRVLRIQPDNAQAKERLERLSKHGFTTPTAAAETQKGIAPKRSKRTNSKVFLPWVIGFLIVCLLCVCGVVGMAGVSRFVTAPPPQLSNETGISQVIDQPTLELAPAAAAPKPTEVPPPTPTSSLAPTDTLLPSLTPMPTGQSLSDLGNPPTCIPPNARFEIGFVTRVIDGDTIEVEIDGQNYTVRYIGMDTPETKKPGEPVQYFGPEADAKNRELVEGKKVVLVKDVSETDRFDRLLRYVFVGNLHGAFVNYELVKQGFAKAKSYPPDKACNSYFQQAQQAAQQAALGIWKPTPIPSITPIMQLPARGGGAPCDCSGPDLNCTGDFKTQAQAQACFNYCKSLGLGDIFGLDKDGDGRACEDLP
ncbi:MAG: hypothetical protein B6D39_11135 [Anaerolineae bacterium UTCFX2]|jgi:micrococcal nuclease|nr:thermonuclease family protein [Anaerolineae bacterium]OQY88831.1 MAG: hypothetical protein B6D39_11135 [Anaerolineae bacterium UTCFX2]